MRRKRKCILIGLLAVFAALVFVVTSARGRPKPRFSSFRLMWVPSRVTYVTDTSKTLSNLPSKNNLQVVPEAKLDPRTAAYYTKDFAGIDTMLHRLSLTLTDEWRFFSSFNVDSVQLKRKWSSDTVDAINIIKRVRNGKTMDSGLNMVKSIDDMMTQVKILKTRAFPMGNRKPYCRGCFENRFTSYIHPWSVCSNIQELDLMILVMSKPENTEARRVIRSTWGSYASNNTNKVKLTFLFGKSRDNPKMDDILKEESSKYHDILQDDYREGYYSLAYKVMSGFRWVVHSCSQAKYVMVVADDIFVNVPAVLQLVEKYGRSEGFKRHLVGKCRTHERPYRWPDYKDYISTLEFEKNAFPPYPEGSMFIASRRLVAEVTKMSPNVAYFPLGDVYMGLVMEQLGRGCHDVEGLVLPYKPRHVPTQPFFGLHPLSPSGLEENYRKLQMHSLTSFYRHID